MQIVIFDLDGTLSLFDHRLHFAEAHDWKAFHEACVDDEPNLPVIRLTQMYGSHGYIVVILCGRSPEFQERTEDWLIRHNVYYDELILQRTRKLPDPKFKEREARAMGLHNIHAVYEDRFPLAAMWRSLGLTCFLTADRPEYDLKKSRRPTGVIVRQEHLC